MGRPRKYPVTTLSPEAFNVLESPNAQIIQKFGPHFASKDGEIKELREYPNQSRILKKLISEIDTNIYEISQYSSWPDDYRKMKRCVSGELCVTDMLAYRFCEALNKIIAKKHGSLKPQLTILDVMAGRILDKTPKDPKIALTN
jgi:hypothetical protein